MLSQHCDQNARAEVYKLYLQCNRGKFRSDLKVAEQNRRRMKGSRYLNCPFSATLLQSKGVGAWVLQIRNNGHNHIPSSTFTHPPTVELK
jgi:hypothetical protein